MREQVQDVKHSLEVARARQSAFNSKSERSSSALTEVNKSREDQRPDPVVSQQIQERHKTEKSE